jgi:hypothetical protein
MRTFKEFLSLAERYYKPTETLPSGKTPLQKASRAFVRHEKDYYSKPESERTLPHARRMANQITRVNRNVRFGADARDFKDYKSDGVEVSAHKHHGMTVHHPESDITYNVSHKGKDPHGRDVHEIIFSHKGRYVPDKNAEDMSDGERKKVAKTAAHIYKTEVEPRLPSGKGGKNNVIVNHPVQNYNTKTGTAQNARAKLYSRIAGFGKPNDRGEQAGIVGRPPSPKQAAKGAKRIKPHQIDDYGSQYNDED